MVAKLFKVALILLIGFACFVSIQAQTNLMDGPECISYDINGNRYLVSSYNTGRIIEIDADGNQSYFGNSYGHILGNHIDGNVFYFTTGRNIVAYDLTAETEIFNLFVPTSSQMDGMTTDTSGHLYVVDFVIGTGGDKVYQLTLSNLICTVFVQTGVAEAPQDIIFDAENNRLLMAGYSAGAPIQQISLPDGNITDLVNTPEGFIDGLARDRFKNLYFTNYQNGNVYRYDYTLSNPPTLISTGNNGPSNIYYNFETDVLCIPNFNADTINFLPMFASFDSDTSWGWAPLTVDFTASSEWDIDSWQWDFGDGGTDDGQSSAHTYETAGIYDVSLQIQSAELIRTLTKKEYILALADTLISSDVTAESGLPVEVTITAKNTLPLKRLVIPVEYSGSLALTYDSFSTQGCRTDYFEHVSTASPDPINRRITFIIYNSSASYANLPPGDGPILKIYFSPPASLPGGRQTPIVMDGYSTRLPSFEGPLLNFMPPTVAGIVSSFLCGDVNVDQNVNLIDILYLIDNLYGNPPGPAPVPEQSGDVNSDGNINLIDILYLIDFLYGLPPGPNPICT